MAIEEGFVAQVKKTFGSNVTVYAQGGMQWGLNPPTNYYCFSTMLDTWLPKISNKSSYTDILIELGSNDVANFNQSNLDNGIDQAIDKIAANFPKSRVHVGIFGKNMLESQWVNRCSVINRIRRIGCIRNALWISGSENVIGAKSFTFDTIHPTTEGHNWLAASLISYMCGGGCPEFIYGATNHTSGLQGLQITDWYNDGKYFVKVSGTLSNNSGITIPGTLGTIGTVVGTVDLPLCHRDISVSGFIQAQLSIFGTTVVHQIPCTIAIVPSNDATTTCTVMLVASYRDYYRDGSGATQIWTDGFTFTQGVVNCAPACIDA